MTNRPTLRARLATAAAVASGMLWSATPVLQAAPSHSFPQDHSPCHVLGDGPTVPDLPGVTGEAEPSPAFPNRGEAMAYRIEPNCVGCTICAQKCPTDAISGETKKLHVIDPVLCIDCGVCTSYCPVEQCIFDEHGFSAAKIKPNVRPIAVVYLDRCSGCQDCVDICPERCLVMQTSQNGVFYSFSSMANAKACTGCRECERICSDKRAILVEWPNGLYCASLGEVPAEWVAPRKVGATAAT